MTDREKKAHREGFLLAARSLFIGDHVFRSIERSVDNLESEEFVRIDRHQWEKLIRRAHKSLQKDELKLAEDRKQTT